MITLDQLQAIAPNGKDLDVWTAMLNDAMQRYDIATPARAAAFLAQVAHESQGLRRMVENLNYAADRLAAVFPSRFPTLDAARPYERNPERLANHVYANRLGNGDEASGDGWRFRGRGLIQVTGRENYHRIGQQLQLPLDAQPELLEQPQNAALSAACYWKANGCNEVADSNTDAAFVRITEIINGKKKEGLADRRQYWAKAKAALGV